MKFSFFLIFLKKSTQVYLNKNKAPPIWKIKPLLYYEEELNRDIKFKCEAYSKPAPTYKWTKNGEILNDNRINQYGNELKINKLNYEDSANYSCVAENELGRIETYFKLNVLSMYFFTRI